MLSWAVSTLPMDLAQKKAKQTTVCPGLDMEKMKERKEGKEKRKERK